MRRYLALALSFLMGSSCSTYSGRPVNVAQIETMPVWRTEGPVTVGVDPYIQPDRQKEVFDDDLEKAKILPIYLLIKNNGERPLSLRRRSEIALSSIVLEHPDGHQISPVQAETVLRILRRIDTPSNSNQDQAIAILMAPFFFPFIPFMVAGAEASKKAKAERVADYMKKELQDAVLNNDASVHGFVFFLPPHETLWSLKGKLVLRFEDKDGSSFIIHVPMSEQ